MIVISLSKCSASLRGDLTKWLLEIDTGVYVGRVTARIRDELWFKIEKNANGGSAFLVYSAKNEQGFEFRTLNTKWNPVDYDGLKLIMRPLPKEVCKRKSKTVVRAAVKLKRSEPEQKFFEPDEYIVLDIETTGLDRINDRIIEFGGIKITNGKITDSLNMLVHCENKLSETIVALTGISDTDLIDRGLPEKEALIKIRDFVGIYPIVAHNAKFDMSFINNAYQRYGMAITGNSITDTLSMARSVIKDIENYRMDTLLKYFDIVADQRHRALADCHATYSLYEKLINLNT